jgi:general secretion pathway protein I
LSGRTPPDAFRRDTAGFTLIEVVVALAVVAVSLAAVGGLMGGTVRGARSLDGRIALVETARAVMAGLPDRGQIRLGNISGEYAGHRWRLDVLPYTGEGAVPDSARWVPQALALRVQSPTGAVLQIDTVRLVRRGRP